MEKIGFLGVKLLVATGFARVWCLAYPVEVERAKGVTWFEPESLVDVRFCEEVLGASVRGEYLWCWMCSDHHLDNMVRLVWRSSD